jgi:hypothetical protein
MFYEAVKKDMANSKEVSFNNTTSSTLSFITVLFEDLFEAVNIQEVLVGEKEEPKPSIKSPKKTNTCDGYDFNIDIINDDEYIPCKQVPLPVFFQFFHNPHCRSPIQFKKICSATHSNLSPQGRGI